MGYAAAYLLTINIYMFSKVSRTLLILSIYMGEFELAVKTLKRDRDLKENTPRQVPNDIKCMVPINEAQRAAF